eukprot:TRINITY_DN874_c0_g1_i2.p1 TRINITY_DN874_c0_g1~~TRINITY_DN874_c0_g1_i2.p1  ORF type:complete len:316 (-),score=75.69 TRINITY_DN874_c0_g1_i2:476-1423(-)
MAKTNLSYYAKPVTRWTFPSVMTPKYESAPSEPNGRRYLHTDMIVRSVPDMELHFMRARWENVDPKERDVTDLVKEVMGLDQAAVGVGVAKCKPKDQLPADGELGGMPLKIDLTLACPKHKAGMRLKVMNEGDGLHQRDITFIKKPDLFCYNTPRRNEARDYFANEVAVMDMLRDKPHDNIVNCLGIVVKEGYIVGIELEYYPVSLEQRCADKTRPLDFDIDKCIQGIADALAHLHKQGYCHNDVKPDNIMLKADDTPVLIDFDSCLPMGEALGKGTTKGWGDDESDTSSVKNDWLGLALVEKHLRKMCLTSSPK